MIYSLFFALLCATCASATNVEITWALNEYDVLNITGGDTVTFVQIGTHTLVELSNYKTCNFGDNPNLFYGTSQYVFTATSLGIFSFGCDVATHCSESGMKIMINVTMPPSEWKCSETFYGAGDGCDCACGAVDPDCVDGEQTVYNCDNEGATCETGECFGGISSSSSSSSSILSVPEEWTCIETFWYDNEGCDCNCGAPDPDCDDPDQVVYNCEEGALCNEFGECGCANESVYLCAEDAAVPTSLLTSLSSYNISTSYSASSFLSDTGDMFVETCYYLAYYEKISQCALDYTCEDLAEEFDSYVEIYQNILLDLDAVPSDCDVLVGLSPAARPSISIIMCSLICVSTAVLLLL